MTSVSLPKKYLLSIDGVPGFVNRLNPYCYSDILRIQQKDLTMRISFYTHPGNFSRTHGYGIAGFKVVTSLQSLGHTVPYDDPSAQAQLNFCQPNWFVDALRPNQYQIGYTPWESTGLPEDWPDILNQCDEVWATSEWVANIYRQNNIKPPIYVYHHGIEEVWRPKKRNTGNVIKFLHHGEPAPRKGGQLAYDAFKAAFGDSKEVSLTIKGNGYSTVRQKTGGPPTGNVRVIGGFYEERDLVNLYHNHDIMVYPSYGEGFGFIPIQALATGMPVICTREWAPYQEYLNELGVEGKYIDSPWEIIHPGKVIKPNLDDLVDKMRYAYQNIEELKEKFFSQSFRLHSEFDWLKVTKDAVQGLEERLLNKER